MVRNTRQEDNAVFGKTARRKRYGSVIITLAIILLVAVVAFSA